MLEIREGDAEGAWAVTEAKCPYCGKEWVAVHPAESKSLECPACQIEHATLGVIIHGRATA